MSYVVCMAMNGVRIYADDQADLRHLTMDLGKAHRFTDRGIAGTVAQMFNQVLMDAMLAGAPNVPGERFKVVKVK